MYKRLLCLSLGALLLTGCGIQQTTSHDAADSTTTASHLSTTHSTSISTTEATSDTSTANTGSTSVGGISNTSNHDTMTTTDVTPSTVLPTSSSSSTNTTASISTTTSTTSAHASSVTFKATVRYQSNQQPVSGVAVTVYPENETSPLGTGITGRDGVVLFTIMKSTAYRVVLGNLPTGYEADASYRFTSNTVNIAIRKTAVIKENDHSNAQYKEGGKIGDFSLTDIDGNAHRLSSLLEQKQLIILDFWFTTCEPCKLEFPYFEAALQEYGDQITLLAINPINDNNAMASLRQKLNASPATAVSFPMLRDTCKLAEGFGVSAYPTTVFIDSNGIILDVHTGAFTSKGDFFATIERYLHE